MRIVQRHRREKRHADGVGHFEFSEALRYEAVALLEGSKTYWARARRFAQQILRTATRIRQYLHGR